MTDCEYVFHQDVREKKSVGRNIRYKNRTGKGGVKMPSDYLTKKEKKMLNSDVTTYDMGKPMTWAEFKKMPDDLQRNYMKGMVDKFHPTQRAIADLMGVSDPTIVRFMEMCNIKPSSARGKRNVAFDKIGWEAWIAGSNIPKASDELSKVSYPGKAAEENPDNFKNMPTDAVVEKFELEAIVSTITEKEPKSEFENLTSTADTKLLSTVAELWDYYLNHREPCILNSKDVAAMLAISKIIDILNNKMSEDDWKELSKYATLASEII